MPGTSERFLTFDQACQQVAKEISTDKKCREVARRTGLTFKTLRDLRYRTDELNRKLLYAFGFDLFCQRVIPYREYGNHKDEVISAIRWEGPFTGTTTLRHYLREEGRPVNRTTLVNILRRLKASGLIDYSLDNRRITKIRWLSNS